MLFNLSLSTQPPLPTHPSVHPGIGRCEEGIHKNRGQILPAAEAGRAAQDGHGQSHRPLFVYEGGSDDNSFFFSFFCLLTRAVTKKLPNQNGQKSLKAFHSTEDSPECWKPLVHGFAWDKVAEFVSMFVEH